MVNTNRVAQHTPGPWEHSPKLSGSENHKGFNIWQLLPGDHGSFIADVSPRDEDGIEGEANARLIAASPRLLAALEEIRDSLKGDLPVTSYIKGIAEAAIAEAVQS